MSKKIWTGLDFLHPPLVLLLLQCYPPSSAWLGQLTLSLSWWRTCSLPVCGHGRDTVECQWWWQHHEPGHPHPSQPVVTRHEEPTSLSHGARSHHLGTNLQNYCKKIFNIITFACEWSFKILVSSIQCLSYGQLKVKDWLGVTGGQLNDIIFTVNVYTLALLVNNGQARDIVLDKFMHHIYHLGTNVCYLDMQ